MKVPFCTQEHRDWHIYEPCSIAACFCSYECCSFRAAFLCAFCRILQHSCYQIACSASGIYSPKQSVCMKRKVWADISICSNALSFGAFMVRDAACSGSHCWPSHCEEACINLSHDSRCRSDLLHCMHMLHGIQIILQCPPKSSPAWSSLNSFSLALLFQYCMRSRY